MKKKIISAACVAVLALVTTFLVSFKEKTLTDNTTDKCILIRATQYGSLAGDNNVIRVYKGGQEVEEISLDRYRLSNERDNFVKIIDVLQKYEQMGYEVASSSESYFGGTPLDKTSASVIITFVMRKQ